MMGTALLSVLYSYRQSVTPTPERTRPPADVLYRALIRLSNVKADVMKMIFRELNKDQQNKEVQVVLDRWDSWHNLGEFVFIL